MLERDAQERGAALGERLAAVGDRGIYVQAAAARLVEPGMDQQLSVDRNRMPEANEDARRDRRERVPGRQKADSFVERRRHEPSVGDAGTALMALVVREIRLVVRRALDRWHRQAQSVRIVAAAPAR